MSVDIDTLLSVYHAATVLKLSRRSIYNHLNSGALQAVKAGSRTLIRQSELDRFIASMPSYKSVAA